MLSEESGISRRAPQNLTLERNNMKNLLMKLWREEEGQDLTEYALLIVLISLVAITTMTTLGKAISDVFSNAAVNLTSAT
jgi:pilus assembly protein Flp/PilA